MDIKKLWEGYKFPKCEKCKKDCAGHLDYSNLCSNLNYLEEYAEKNYEKNKESLIELKKLLNNKTPTIFSFGCGLGLDYIAVDEIFNKNAKYYGIDECDWAIKKTDNYKDFKPTLPKTIKYDTGMFFLKGQHETPVLCFFNSLFTISNNSNLKEDLISALKNKNCFYLVCDYTINANYHMPSEEQDFIAELQKELKNVFRFKKIDILGGNGIIIYGVR